MSRPKPVAGVSEIDPHDRVRVAVSRYAPSTIRRASPVGYTSHSFAMT